VLNGVLYMAVFPMNAMYIGNKYGTTELGAICLANFIANLTGRSIIKGMLSAFFTKGPHAMGLKNYEEIGLLA